MELPATFGKYVLEEFLGGGMSHVYRARDKVLGRTVAVKILTGNALSDSEAKARFLREAKTAGNIDHENIIHIYDFGVTDGQPYMVMEFLRGQDLRQAISNNQTGDLRNRLEFARGLARALGHIHSTGIIHRDIKPENVHIDQNGKVKLMDFGIAKSQDLNLTRPGFTLGTPSYMAPEQVRGEEVTPSVDIYAFGLLLHELITGVKPVQGKTVQEIFKKILAEDIPMEPLVAAGAGTAVVELVRRCVQKEPQSRPADFAEVTQVLDYIIYEMDTGQPVSGSYTSLREAAIESAGTSRPVWLIPAIAGAGLLLVALVVVLILGLGSNGGKDPTKQGSASSPEGMILIPAGPFPYGTAGNSLTLPNYFIDKTEVSNAAYAKFCATAGKPAPRGVPNEPVSGITLDDAQAFARWAGKRLPTPQEWEKAARGAKGAPYPWGDDHAPANAVVADNPNAGGKKAPVDSMPQSASYNGVLHMVGNVREYVLEFNSPTPEQVRAFARLLSPAPTAAESWVSARGGSFREPLPHDANLNTILVPARYAADNVGFRCVKDAP